MADYFVPVPDVEFRQPAQVQYCNGGRHWCPPSSGVAAPTVPSDELLVLTSARYIIAQTFRSFLTPTIIRPFYNNIRNILSPDSLKYIT